MKGSQSHQSRFPAQRAFVVQVARSETGESDVPLGRVEHLVSGKAAKFASWTELQAFIEQVLTQVEERPP